VQYGSRLSRVCLTWLSNRVSGPACKLSPQARTGPHAVAAHGQGRVLAAVQPLQLRVHVQVALVAALGASLRHASFDQQQALHSLAVLQAVVRHGEVGREEFKLMEP